MPRILGHAVGAGGGGLKVTPIKILGSRMYFNLNATSMASKADKYNRKAEREGLDNLMAQIAQDANLGMYYGIYAVKLWNLDEALKKLGKRRRKFFIIQFGDGNSEYTYLSIYWGHRSSPNKISAGTFKNYVARYIAETVLFSGKHHIKSVGEFTSGYLKDEIENMCGFYSRSLWQRIKAEITNERLDEQTKKGFYTDIIKLMTNIFVGVMKGDLSTLYVPDPVCMKGMLTIDEDDPINSVDTACHKVGEIMKASGLRYVLNVALGRDWYDKFIKYAKDKYQKSLKAQAEEDMEDYMSYYSQVKNPSPEMTKMLDKIVKKKYGSMTKYLATCKGRGRR